MTNDESDFEPGSVVDVELEMQVGDGNIMKLTKMGVIRVKQGKEGKIVRLKEGYLAPMLPIKLLSLGVLIKAGFEFRTEGSVGYLSKAGKDAFKATLKSGIWIIRGLEVVKSELAMVVDKDLADVKDTSSSFQVNEDKGTDKGMDQSNRDSRMLLSGKFLDIPCRVPDSFPDGNGCELQVFWTAPEGVRDDGSVGC